MMEMLILTSLVPFPHECHNLGARCGPTITFPGQNLSFAKIPSGREINNLRDFLTVRTRYNSCPCPAGSGSGSEYLFASFVRAEACSWRIWHSGNNSPR
jgi:hypothetical protein